MTRKNQNQIHYFRRWIPAILTILVLVLNGEISRSVEQSKFWKDLNELSLEGFTYRFLDDETVVIKEPLTGRIRTKTLTKADEQSIVSWIEANDIPLLEIDPSTIDTTFYQSWYTFWTSVPITNDRYSRPVIGDINHNNRPEFYGFYKDSLTAPVQTKIYEVNPLGWPVFRAELVPRRGPAQQFMNVDQDLFIEVMFHFGDSSYVYEQASWGGLPTTQRFVHSKWDYPGTAIITNEIVADLDGDSLDDFLYNGTFVDSVSPYWDWQYATFVAEYDPALGNFVKIWKTQLRPPPGGAGVQGYDAGDYDGDGFMNFLASGIWGEIWLMENTGDNSYEINWTDTIPFVNVYYQTSGDVDGNGKREFFISATMSDGNWITVFEADSNDHYSPRFMFHLLSGGSLDEPTLMTTDVDGDGGVEFVILSGADLFIFKGDGEASYRLWYYKLNDAKHSIQFYDFNNDGLKDFVISKGGPSSTLSPYYHSDIFLADSVITGVEEPDEIPIPRETELLQNYPNPFNPATTIRYRLHRATDVDLRIYSVSGEEVEVLTHERREPGTHTVRWSPGPRIGSGIYFVRLRSAGVVYSRKMIYLK